MFTVLINYFNRRHTRYRLEGKPTLYLMGIFKTKAKQKYISVLRNYIHLLRRRCHSILILFHFCRETSPQHSFSTFTASGKLMASFTTLQPQRTRNQQKYVSTDLEAYMQILSMEWRYVKS